MKVVTLGATRGIGRSLARLFAGRGDSIHLLGRNADDLAKCAEDLLARGAASVTTGLCDLLAPATFAPALDAADAALGGFDTVVLSAGLFGTQDDLANDRDRGRFNAVSSGAFQGGAITAPIVAGLLLERELAGVFIALIVTCLGGVALLALALERRITPEVNGIRR